MKKRYRFQTAIKVGPRKFKPGDEITEGEVPSGNLASLLRLGQLKEATEKPVEPAKEVQTPAPVEADDKPVGPAAEVEDENAAPKKGWKKK